MDQLGGRSVPWGEEATPDSTADPNVLISTIGEEVPNLTVATILGVIVVVIIAIAFVFVLGVLIDCRQQRILDQRLGEVKRRKQHRRVISHRQGDVVSIVNNMEEPGLSAPSIDVLRNIP